LRSYLINISLKGGGKLDTASDVALLNLRNICIKELKELKGRLRVLNARIKEIK